MMNKKGAELTIGIIVIIILSLVVLVVVIYGFTVGWGNLFQQILGFGGGNVNVQTIVSSCQVSCSTQSTFDYCSRTRNVVFNEGEKGSKLTCFRLEDGNPDKGAIPNVGLTRCDLIDLIQCKDSTDKVLGQSAV